MHYDSPHNTRKRTVDVDLLAAETRIQLHPGVQYPAKRLLSDRAPFAHALSGYDPDRIACAEYPWTVP
jgi:hypothetical protein